MGVQGVSPMLQDFYSILGNPAGIFNAISEVVRIIAAITFIFAALQCFLGYKLFKFWIAVCGFFTFGILGGIIGAMVAKNTGIAVFCGILFAILGAFAAYKLYKIGVFILCGFMGFILGYILTQSAALGIIMAVALGVLGVFFVKPVIIISTGISGGLLAGSSIATVFNINDSLVSIILGILFAVFGVLVQFATNKKVIDTNQQVSQNNIAQSYVAPVQYPIENMTPQPADKVNTSIYCPGCGALNKGNAIFCVNCGTKIAPGDPGDGSLVHV